MQKNDMDLYAIGKLDIGDEQKFADELSVGIMNSQTWKPASNDILQLLVKSQLFMKRQNIRSSFCRTYRRKRFSPF